MKVLTAYMTPQKKIIITSIILLALIAGLLFAFITISNNVASYRDSLIVTAAKISSNEKKIVRMVAVSNLIKENEQNIQRIKHIAIDSRRPLSFIETIERVGRNTDVKIALAVEEKKENTQSLLFHATLVGEHNNIHAMLALIQQLPYQIKIESLSFQRNLVPSLISKQAAPASLAQLILTMRVATQQ